MPDVMERLRGLDPERRAAVLAALAERGEEFNVFPVSSGQRRLWLLDEMHRGSPAYNVPYAFRLRGEYDVDALAWALRELGRRHESLRTVFLAVSGEPRQVILPEPQFALECEDCSGVPEAERDAFVDTRAARSAAEPFELDSGPLVRARLLRFTGTDAALLLCLHHIVCDGWSIGVLFSELERLYGAHRAGTDADLAPLTVQYVDYTQWQARWLANPASDSHRAYWRGQLVGAPALLDLGTDLPRPPVRSLCGALEWFTWPAATAQRLARFCAAEAVTPFMALMAAYQALLHRYSGSQDIVVGTGVANRIRPEVQRLVGFLVNTAALRCTVTAQMSFRALLGQVRQRALAVQAHQELPYEAVVDGLRLDRSASYHPVFQTLLILSDGEADELRLPGLEVTAVPTHSGTSKFDLMIAVTSVRDEIKGWVEYDTALFHRQTVLGLLDHLHELLIEAMTDAERPVGQLLPRSALRRVGATPAAGGGASGGTATPATAAVAGGGALERSIVEVWREVLRRDRIGLDDNFFDLGGNSILLVRARARLEEVLGREVRALALLQYPTVRSLAQHLGSAGSPAGEPASRRGSRGHGDRPAADRGLLSQRASRREVTG